MAPITGASFLLAGLSLILFVRRQNAVADTLSASTARGSLASGILATLVAAANLLVLMGYLYDAPDIYGGGHMLVAFTTALCFLLFVVGLACLSGPAAFP